MRGRLVVSLAYAAGYESLWLLSSEKMNGPALATSLLLALLVGGAAAYRRLRRPPPKAAKPIAIKNPEEGSGT